MVALDRGWIKGKPSLCKPWVANRVTMIQRFTDPTKWRHVLGKESPKDVVKKGIQQRNLLTLLPDGKLRNVSSKK